MSKNNLRPSAAQPRQGTIGATNGLMPQRAGRLVEQSSGPQFVIGKEGAVQNRNASSNDRLKECIVDRLEDWGKNEVRPAASRMEFIGDDGPSFGTAPSVSGRRPGDRERAHEDVVPNEVGIIIWFAEATESDLEPSVG